MDFTLTHAPAHNLDSPPLLTFEPINTISQSPPFSLTSASWFDIIFDCQDLTAGHNAMVKTGGRYLPDLETGERPWDYWGR